VILLSLAIFGASGCSTFDQDWEAARHAPRTPRPAATAAENLSGAWEGSWKSSANGHGGELRGIFESMDENRYEVRFHATFGGVFSFEYTVPIRVAREALGQGFEGQADLGPLAWGLYLYRGQIVGDEFTARYDCGFDHGTFFMERRDAGLGSAP